MSVTINTFPPVQSFNSRSWALLAIMTLHLGFFWALTSGLSMRIIDQFKPAPQLVPVEPIKPTTRERPMLPSGIGTLTNLDRRTPRPREFIVDEETKGSTDTGGLRSDPAGGIQEAHKPVVVTPGIDPAVGLSEPLYPPAEIRQQHTGTVLLSVQVLANGRVGEVRIDQSSGYPRLDASAVREARDWRFKPGTSDGVPIVMWKQVPITFRLK